MTYIKLCKLLCNEQETKEIGFVSLSRRNNFALTEILDYLYLSDVIAVLISLQKITPTFYPSQRLLERLLSLSLNEEICFDTAELVQTLVLAKPEMTLDGLHRLYQFLHQIPIELPNSTLWQRGSCTFAAPGMQISLSCNQCQKVTISINLIQP